MKQDQIVIYQTEDGRTNVLEHIQHIYEDEELEKEATCRNFRQVRQEGCHGTVP